MNMIRAVAGRLASVGACVVFAGLLGCGGASNGKAGLSGKVTYKGAPVTGGTIQLTSSSTPPFTISIKEDGTFVTEDAPAGTLKAAIETDSVTDAVQYQPTKDMPAPPPQTSAKKRVAIPAKYKNPDTSGLTWDTKTEKTKTFELTD